MFWSSYRFRLPYFVCTTVIIYHYFRLLIFTFLLWLSVTFSTICTCNSLLKIHLWRAFRIEHVHRNSQKDYFAAAKEGHGSH